MGMDWYLMRAPDYYKATAPCQHTTEVSNSLWAENWYRPVSCCGMQSVSPASAAPPRVPIFLRGIILISVTKPENCHSQSGDPLMASVTKAWWPPSKVFLMSISLTQWFSSGQFSGFRLLYSNFVLNGSFNDSKAQVQIDYWVQS